MFETDRKRLIIAMVLSFLVIIFYPKLLEYLGIETPATRQEETTAEQPVAQTEKTDSKQAEPTKPAKTVKAEPPVTPSLPEVEERLVTVDTPLYTAVLSSYGGGLKSFKLKHYKQTMEEGSKPVDIVNPVDGIYPLMTRLKVTGLPEVPAFTITGKDLSIEKGQKGELLFVWHGKDGTVIEKRYIFSPDNYTLDVEVKITNGRGESIKGTVLNEISGKFVVSKSDSYFHHGPLRRIDGKTKRQDPETTIEMGKGSPEWIGVEDKYFLLAIIPEDNKNTFWESTVPSQYAGKITFGKTLELEPSHHAITSFTAYMGPKEYDRLIAMGRGLDEAIEFGLFSLIARPLLVVLNFFERYVGNYGIAIILLTVVIKLLFYPLTKHSLNSMRKMQEIQPQMLAIRERYKNDRERMNKELYELYKRYKINPLSGCLPIFLQLPVFVGLYEVLSVAIELRHAPFMLWIQDLSAKDPYYITPVLMGISMFIQQKMTPTTMDPTQAKIMLIMPVILTFLFMSFPSGLVIYWLVNNILSIAQQYQIYKDMGKAKA
ncbi:MAG TPA: membrane protein insertase YidC [Deltaproteobacteria bacterium]|nr:membrane protein insertase YidC [Deltaproteobacteria bacterium]